MSTTSTQLQAARRGVVTPEMRRVAERELVAAELVREHLPEAYLTVPGNYAFRALAVASTQPKTRPGTSPTSATE